MNTNDIFAAVFSSTLLATIVTSIFNLLINQRKDSIENIIKERKTWRDEMRKIALLISKSSNIVELQVAISKLKVRINAYGIAHNSIFSDSHIWEQIYMVESVESLPQKELDNIKRVFENQISCLLKYDWERSKTEIKGNTQTKVVIASLIISYVMYSFRWFYDKSIGRGKDYAFFTYTVFFMLFCVFSILMIYLADKWKNELQFYEFIVGGILGIIGFYYTIYIYLPNTCPSNSTEIIISLMPFISLIYSVQVKLLFYRRNVNYFILASALSCGSTKIHKKYRIFFSRKDYTNLLSGEKITFEDFEEIIQLRSTHFSYSEEKENTNSAN